MPEVYPKYDALRPLEPGEIEYVTNVVRVGVTYSAPDGFELDFHAATPCPDGVQVTWKRVGKTPVARVELEDRRFCNALSPSRYNRCTLEPDHEPPRHQLHDVWAGHLPGGQKGVLAEWDGDERDNLPGWSEEHEPDYYGARRAPCGVCGGKVGWDRVKDALFCSKCDVDSD